MLSAQLAPPRTPESVMVVAPLAVPVTPEPKFRVPAFVMVVGPVFTVVGEDTVTELAISDRHVAAQRAGGQIEGEATERQGARSRRRKRTGRGTGPIPPVRRGIPALTETVCGVDELRRPTVVVPVPEVLPEGCRCW